MKNKGLIIWIVFVMLVMGAIFARALWSAPGDPVIENKSFGGITGTSGVLSSVTATEIYSNTVRAGTSKWYVYGNTTLSADMLAGGMLFCHFSGPTPFTLTIPSFTGSTPYFLVADMTGSGVTITPPSGVSIYDGTSVGTYYFVNKGNSRHQAALTLNAESGACKYGFVVGKTGSNWKLTDK
jgi:hypothetical protein